MLKFIEALLEKFFRADPEDLMKSLPRKVTEKIFSYMNGNDLLSCSLVNKEWNRFIGKSPKCMDKIRVFICEPYQGMWWKFTTSDVHNMLKGGRKYKHISLFITRNITMDHQLFLASFKWKSLHLYDHIFKNEIELVNFIGLIEPSIKELILESVRTAFSKNKEIAPTNFLFPKLKRLRVSKSCAYFFTDVFKNVKTLDCFEIETEASSIPDRERIHIAERVRGIQSILLKNSGIRNLALFLHQRDFNYMFVDERFLALIHFQLHTFKVNKFKMVLVGFETNTLQVLNFCKFLQSQKKSLQVLHLLEWMGNSTLEVIINTLDSLKVLVLENLECYGKFDGPLASLNLFKNESIETLSINSKQKKCDELLKILLKIVPNLKNLNIGTMNQTIFETVIDKISKIESITVDIFIPYIIPEGEVLRSLKEMRIKLRYAENFKDMLRDYDDYTNFEAVFLKAVKSYNEENFLI